MKKVSSLFMLVLFSVFLAACNGSGNEELKEGEKIEIETTEVETSEIVEPFTVKVVAPAGVPALSVAKMVVENPTVTESANIEYEITTQTDVLTSKIINGEADIAVVPTNLAATLYNKGSEFKLVGSSVWGVMYMVSSEEIETFEDLKGKTIATIGQNLTPDAVTRYILEANGLVPDEDVKFEYFGGAPELASYYISGQTDLAIIPQPVLTNVLAKREDSSIVFDMQEEWYSITNMWKYPQASLIISNELILNNPKFVEDFISEYNNSTSFVNENPKMAGEYYESLEIGLSASVIESAIPQSNVYFVDIEDCKDEVNKYLEILFEFNPKLLGGIQVDNEFYK